MSKELTQDSAPPLRVGIIGCGIIANTHITSYRALPNVEVTWLCDLKKEKAETLAGKYAIENVTSSYKDLLRDDTVDCISVCTDHASHAVISIDAVNAGKHVLCEKSLAASTSDLDAITAAAQQHPQIIFSGVFQHRFDHLYRVLREVVAQNIFGTILTAGISLYCRRTAEYYMADEWRGTWAKEGGSVLINQAIHFVDALAWIMGGVSTVCGRHLNITHGNSIETEDTAVASLQFKNGALGIIEATCSSSLSWAPTLHIHGTDGAIEVQNGNVIHLEMTDTTVQGKLAAKLTEPSAQQPDSEPVANHAYKTYYGTGHLAQIADFVESIREKRRPEITALDARHAVDIVLGIYESHGRGQWVNID